MATYRVIIGNLVDENVANAIATWFRNNPTKPESITITIEEENERMHSDRMRLPQENTESL